jgi:hypothetical protein
MIRNYIRLLSLALLMMICQWVVAKDFSLTIYNKTPANFFAITVDGQYLGYVSNQVPTTLTVPFVPSFPTYAVLLQGDNGNNAFISNDGSGPECSTQLTYHHCVFSGKLPSLTVNLLWP